MKTAFNPAGYDIWQARQPMRFGLGHGCPRRLPDEEQAPTRVTRVRQIACHVLRSQDAATEWMTTPEARLGGSKPEMLTGNNEVGCEAVLRALVVMGRFRETSRG